MLRSTGGELQKSTRDNTHINEPCIHKAAPQHSERREDRGRQSKAGSGQDNQVPIQLHGHKTLFSFIQ